jgi:hypothetical protein
MHEKHVLVGKGFESNIRGALDENCMKTKHDCLPAL